MKKLLALVLALVMSMSLVTISNAAFKDADEISYKEAVDVMASVGVLEGYNNEFSPKDELTRAQAAKIIAYLDLGKDVAEALPAVQAFSDVPATHWASKYIAYLSQAGIVNGVGDGKFAPDGKVTGYEFAKMLLVVLGYKADVEKMTGASWAINVAKLAKANNLTKGYKTALSADLTREAAAQMAFNDIKAAPVTYSGNGSQITLGGTVIDFGWGNAVQVKDADGTVQQTQAFYWTKYENKLKKDTLAITDDFGRPSHGWIYDKKDVGSYVDTPVATFTAATKAADVATALNGYYLADNGVGDAQKIYKIENSTKYTTDSTPATSFTSNMTAVGVVGDTVANKGETIAKAIADVTANGSLVEVYANSKSIVTKIVVVNYTVAKVTAVAKTSDRVTYTIGGLSKVDYVNPDATDSISFQTAPAKGDIVTYFLASNSKMYVYPTTSVTGAQTSKNSDNEITVAGTKYAIGTAVTGVNPDDFNNSSKDAVYYIDQFGNVVKTTSTAASGDYALIADVNAKINTTIDGKTPAIEVRAVLADGTVGVYTLDIEKVKENKGSLVVGDYVLADTSIKIFDVGTAYANNEAYTTAVNNILDNTYGYTISGSTITLEALNVFAGGNPSADTVYSVTLDTDLNGPTTGTPYVLKDKTSYTEDGMTVLVNADTKFVVYNSTKNTAAVYTSATLSSDMTGTTFAEAVLKTGSTATTGTASVVFVEVPAALSVDSTDKYAYIDGTEYSTSKVDGKTVYTYSALLADGTKIDLTKESSAVATGVYEYNAKNEVGDAVDASLLKAANAAEFKVDGSLIKVGAAYYNVTDDTKTVFADADLGSIDGNYGYVVLALKNGVATTNVETIFVVSEKPF